MAAAMLTYNNTAPDFECLRGMSLIEILKYFIAYLYAINLAVIGSLTL